MTNVLLTICIMHYKKLEKLKKTISFIEANTATSYKLKILNQGYLDAQIESYLKDLDRKENVEVLFHDENIGPSAGRAVLFDKLDTPYVLSLDDDIYLPEGWDRKIIKFLEATSGIDVVGLSLIAPDGHLLESALDLAVTADKTLIVSRYVTPVDKFEVEKDFFVVDDVLEGAMLLRSSVAAKIVWDPAYTVALEGIDKGLQLKDLGAKVVLYTGMQAVHDSVSLQNTFREYNLVRRNYHEIRKNYLHLSEKWGVRLPFLRHVFYKYICKILPQFFLRLIAYFWLNTLKPFLKRLNIDVGIGTA